MILFGQQFNQQVSTTENLALGSKARDLRSSFTRGVEEHTNVPLEQQGLGGKEFDKGKQEMADPYEDAVLDYYGNQKVKGRRDNREGMDYFATPEPVGFKWWNGLCRRRGNRHWNQVPGMVRLPGMCHVMFR